METIYLSPEDDIVSICDRLNWVQGRPRVLLVLPAASPAEEPLLTSWLDLVRLRRCAAALRLEVGLVTRDGEVAAQARALGFPVFGNERDAASRLRRWWRGRREWRRPTRPGATVRLGEGGELKSLPDVADRREMYRRMAPRPSWQRWLWHYVAILLFFLTMALLVIAAAYTVPGATITFYPEVERVEVVRQIVADPQLESVSFSGASVPGRRLSVTVSWQAEVQTTGGADVPDAPARGTVVFVNRQDSPVTVPAGTRVSTSAGARQLFQTVEATEVPGVRGATAEAQVVAITPGPEGNVGANLINRVVGALAVQLDVRNLDPLTGGGVRRVAAVAEEDRERLRSQVLQHLQSMATAELEALLEPGEFLARDSLRLGDVLQETYSRFPGEQSERLALELRAEMEGTAVDASQANGLIYETLAEAIKPGYELVPESLQFRAGDVLGVDEQGRVTFDMIGEANVAATLALDEPLQAITGQQTDVAMAYLYERLPLRRYPEARVFPGWFGRIPYLPVRIQTEIAAVESP
ncbi:MAG: hypothetical protein GX579_21240 [Chloroflexi bacterium]|nr:hypothetical protein [Chloroflexota bacterium]